MVAATGIGSMPGTDIKQAQLLVVGELPDFVHLVETPALGAPASMTGRATAVMDALGFDLQPAGWRLTDATGIDQRRAASILHQQLDVLEELTQGYVSRLKTQIAGPWTLAATLERPRGDRILADHGARRDVAQALAAGVAAHVAELGRRVPGATLVVQVDEPALPAVLAGEIPTASGFSRHRSVDTAAAAEALGWVFAAIRAARAIPILHCCAADVPLAQVIDAGAAGVSFDLGLVRESVYDDIASMLEGGGELWLGVIPALDSVPVPTDRQLVETVQRRAEDVGFDPAALDDRLVVTPACGLAGASPQWARRALRLARSVSSALRGESAGVDPDERS
jgi:methionine synthase II (cobalamin-independent)